MTLHQLSCFLAAVEHGSFSAAADSQHMAQPSLSEQVRRLEAELGVELFARVGRGLVLTEAGHAFRPHAERVVADAQEAREAMVEVREVRGGSVSLGMFGNAPFYLLTDLVEAFRERHPGVRVRIVGQNSSEVAGALRAGEFEAAVLALPIDDTGLDVRPLMRDEILYVSADAARTRRPVKIERLAEVPLIVYDARYGWEDPTRRQLQERAQRAGIALEPAIEIEDTDAAVQIAARGLGDTYAASAVTRGEHFPSERLHTAPFDPPMHDTLAIVTRRGGGVSPALRELLALAEERMAAFAESLKAPGAAR
ncbi:MAG TPA: LysR family transcriptional regulator [Solirubrobacteraceae bacterium]|nr:LysR family transcriptional regulator [Solirubrobacteraceae bacterium]